MRRADIVKLFKFRPPDPYRTKDGLGIPLFGFKSTKKETREIFYLGTVSDWARENK